MGRPVTWDTEHGLRMWLAGVSMNRIAKRFKIRPMTVANYAMHHRWPARVVDKEAPEPPHPSTLTEAGAVPCERIALYRTEKARRVKLGPADDLAEARLRLRQLEERAA